MSKTIKRIEFTIIEDGDFVETIRVFHGVKMYEVIGFLSIEADRLRNEVLKDWENEKEVKPDGSDNKPR